MIFWSKDFKDFKDLKDVKDQKPNAKRYTILTTR